MKRDGTGLVNRIRHNILNGKTGTRRVRNGDGREKRGTIAYDSLKLFIRGICQFSTIFV